MFPKMRGSRPSIGTRTPKISVYSSGSGDSAAAEPKPHSSKPLAAYCSYPSRPSWT